MVTVTTKEELEKALKSKEKEILVEGEIAKKIVRKKKMKKGALIAGGVSVLGGIALLPFTGGASAIAIAQGLTVGGVTITTAEAALGAGAILSVASLALLRNYEIEYESTKDGKYGRTILRLKQGKQ